MEDDRINNDLSALIGDDVQRLLVDGGLLAVAVMRGATLTLATPEFLRLLGVASDAGPAERDALVGLLERRFDADTGDGGIHHAQCAVEVAGDRSRSVELRACRTSANDEPVLVVLASDVTDREREIGRLQFLAMHDPLTGLPNRASMLERLEQAVESDIRHAHGCAVLLVDLDHFKEVNDRHGHDTGDALLQEVACRLSACCRQSDVVARYGGDEFVLVASPIGGGAEATVLAARVVADLERDFDFEGRHCEFGASVGIAVRGEAQESAALLLSKADAAMYRAKAEGRNRYAFPEVDRDALMAIPDMRWHSEHSVGIAQVDREHRDLSERMNALLGRVRDNEGSDALARGLHDLLQALARHFATEERYMHEHPGALDDEHRNEHRRVMDDLRRLSATVTADSLNLSIRYLYQWLYRHVGSFDQHLGVPATDR